jgi:hypothetical protein
VSGFNLQGFLDETGITLHKLATYLQVAESYLESAAAGATRLTRRDETACRKLRRRLTQWKQLDLPFAEPPATFSRDHARAKARARAIPAKVRSGRRPSSPASAPATPGRRSPRAQRAKKAR